MHIVGVDLSGPANREDTAAVWGAVSGPNLKIQGHQLGVDDGKLVKLVVDLCSDQVCVGLDAPLAYNQNGGSRPGDRELRERLSALGMPPGSVMAPTAPRMCYLTLRGVAVARLLTSLDGPHCPLVVEVHPGGTLALGGAPICDVRKLKADPGARERPISWLEGQGIADIPADLAGSDHLVAATAAALATWNWHRRTPSWMLAADPPHHPFDFVC